MRGYENLVRRLSGIRIVAINSFCDRVAKTHTPRSRASARLSLLLILFECIGLSACGLGIEQRSAIIAFGHSLDEHGQLVAEESTYIRSEVKAMRVLAMSLP